MNDMKLKLILISFTIFMVAGMSADRIGYLMTNFSLVARVGLVFPCITLIWYVWIFKFRWGGVWHGVTIHEVNLKRFGGRAGRMKILAAYLLGFPLLLASFAWFSIGIPAWLAKLSASEPFAREYVYTPEAFIANGYKFTDTLTGEHASVRPTLLLYESFPDEVRFPNKGKLVCLRGRTSLFGSIITKIQLGRC